MNYGIVDSKLFNSSRQEQTAFTPLVSNWEVILDPQFLAKPEARDGEYANHLLIGIGKPGKQPTADGFCILNYKGTDKDLKIGSVSEFVSRADAAWVASWRQRFPANGKRPTVVIEDLSLDTCFSFILFLKKLHGLPIDEVKTRRWVDYVTSWEEGYYPDRHAEPVDSLACIISLLGHSYLNDIAARPERVRQSFFEACDFLSGLYDRFSDPNDVAYERNAAQYRRALGRYTYECDQFKAIVRQGQTCQLSIPEHGSSNRLLVDAIIFEEPGNETGILKTLLRRDVEHSWLKRGFSLMAVYRPRQAGSNDMTISVDPDRNLSLDDLWRALESLEDEKWERARPRSEKGGRQLKSYLESGKPRDQFPHQPWYDGRDSGAPCATLLAAPMHVNIDGKPQSGTKLTWQDDVLPALWTAYSPIPTGLKLERRQIAESGKALAIVTWTASCGNPALTQTPTFTRWLAAQSMNMGARDAASTGAGRALAVRSPMDLPPPDSFEVLSVPGGTIVVHRDGATLFDDWSTSKLRVADLTATATQVGASLAALNNFLKADNIHTALELQSGLQNAKKFDVKKFEEWRGEASKRKAKLLQALSDGQERIEDYDQTRLRRLIESYWGLGDKRTQVFDLIDRADQVTQQLFDQVKERNSRLLNTIVAGVSGGLLVKEAIEPFKNKFTHNLYEWQIAVMEKTHDLGALKAIAHELSKWETYSMLGFFVGAGIGIMIYRTRDIKLGE